MTKTIIIHTQTATRIRKMVTGGSRMKIMLSLLLATGMAALLGGCGVAGGPFPVRDASAFLKREGYPEETIRAVIQGSPLPPDLVEKLSKSGSPDVRILVGNNPYLTPAQIDMFINSWSWNGYAKTGAARNPNLTRKQIRKLSFSFSRLVLLALAENPSVPEDVLWSLRRYDHVPMHCFANNPKCPAAWRKEILESNDELAKSCLKATDEWVKMRPPGAPYWRWGT